MADHTKIEWTEATWNPIVGCTLASPGCTNCYAMRMADRLESMALKADGEGNVHLQHYVGTTERTRKGVPVWTGKMGFNENALTAPLRRKKPTMYFVNSMGDLFHENLPDEWIDRVFAVMALAPQHTFQVLSKRSGRMREYLTARNGMGNGHLCRAINAIPGKMGNRHGALSMPLPNVWLGVSVEDQQRAEERIPYLLDTPAVVRWLSCEPLLGPIDLFRVKEVTGHTFNALSRKEGIAFRGTGLDWIVAGGESGSGARPMHPDWARALRDQCAAAGVPFFFKQWGEWAYWNQQGADGVTIYKGYTTPEDDDRGCHFWPEHPPFRDGGDFSLRVGKKQAGRQLDGQLHDARPAGVS